MIVIVVDAIKGSKKGHKGHYSKLKYRRFGKWAYMKEFVSTTLTHADPKTKAYKVYNQAARALETWGKTNKKALEG
jgi:hypothetical protein